MWVIITKDSTDEFNERFDFAEQGFIKPRRRRWLNIKRSRE
jgi:hypothetical protein